MNHGSMFDLSIPRVVILRLLQTIAEWNSPALAVHEFGDKHTDPLHSNHSTACCAAFAHGRLSDGQTQF